MSEPHTAAGRRLHARIFGLSDRMPDGAELDSLILAIEAEAADLAARPAEAQAGAGIDALRAALERFLYVATLRPPDHDELEDAIRVARNALASLPTEPEAER